jgi:hypothetical protein
LSVGLPGTAEVELHVIPVSPQIDILRDELGTIINLDPLRLPMLPGDSFKNFGNLQTPDPRSHMDGQALTGMVIH